MSGTILYKFATDDPRARLTWWGRNYRVVRIEVDPSHGLSVWVVRLTKTGADYRRPHSYMWLTLACSLDRFDEGTALAAYVRNLALMATANKSSGGLREP